MTAPLAEIRMAIACQGQDEVLLKRALGERGRRHLFGSIMRRLSARQICLHYPDQHPADNTVSFAFPASIFPRTIMRLGRRVAGATAGSHFQRARNITKG